jgi:regulator of PEP synthase PpsR (kinase-PPPase family)
MLLLIEINNPKQAERNKLPPVNTTAVIHFFLSIELQKLHFRWQNKTNPAASNKEINFRKKKPRRLMATIVQSTVKKNKIKKTCSRIQGTHFLLPTHPL